jgi:molybdate transport system substrate-binding protein
LAHNIALAGEDVPVGGYAREILDNMGILEDVMDMEINECANVSAVLAAVSEASNEIGITYATDAFAQLDTVEIIAQAPQEYLETPVIYPVGLVKNPNAKEEQKEAAQEFLEYLQTEASTEIFETYLFSNYQE